MKTIIKRMLIGNEFWKLVEEFFVPQKDVVGHQWYKRFMRSDKLLAAGNRVRGDVLV